MGKRAQTINKRLRIFIADFLFSAILVIGITIRISNLNVTARSPDEQVYTQQAGVIAEKGNQGIGLLAREYNMNSVMWIYPPPTRIGYLWPLAVSMKLFNNIDVKIGSYLSCFFSIVSLFLLVLAGLRFFNKWIALIGLLFLSVSPMDLAIARRTWQDAMFGCLGFLLIYLACEISRASRKIILHILFVITGSYLILIKEPGAIIYGMCVIWIFWVMAVKEKFILKGALFALANAVAACFSIVILANATGGFLPLIEVFKHIKEAMPTNQYAIDYQTGPWYNFFLGLWIISPAGAILCLIGIIDTLLNRTLKTGSSVTGMMFFSIIFMSIAIITPYCQNLRYISVLYVPFYLMSGLGLWRVILFAKSMSKGFALYCIISVIIGAVCFSALSDYKKFEKIFLKTGILDVSIRMVKECSR